MHPPDPGRRRWVGSAGIAALGGLMAGVPRAALADEERSTDVLAVEDLMREHGVLRRALLVYAEAATRLRSRQAIPAEALHRAAALFRRFGEDYHERSLEERHVFPALIIAGGTLTTICRTLAAQHQRGRQLTDYILATSAGHGVGRSAMDPLAAALAGLVRMYQHHAAIEDTVVFPAWKKTLTAPRYSELSEQFEALEQKMVGRDGFEGAVGQIHAIEQAFGLADLAALTAAPPPAAPAR
ncbi:MAG TPA: hemerythrin domain-containing protein [Frateuria sp.]|uniref:hemerythrin domain-containing protein n=1 Tax=Frateuria sp. TaxID=2211372 RepID=UPI002D7EE8F0|nr:hemerythrin domain-containing protein [Frateuria sp.]HET6804493.1 hemerythrin domain-containing protein [Frateuria sp.]